MDVIGDKVDTCYYMSVFIICYEVLEILTLGYCFVVSFIVQNVSMSLFVKVYVFLIVIRM